MKRATSFILAVGLIFSLSCNVRAHAVGPAAGLGAAVVFSFLWSAGIELWRDGAGQDQTPQEALESAIADLWSEFHSSNGSAPSLDRLEGEITFDQFGRAIIKNNIALALNDFIDWFKDTYEIAPGSTIALTDEGSPGDAYLFTLPASEAASLPGYQTAWALPVASAPGSLVAVEMERLNKTAYFSTQAYMFRTSSHENQFHFCSLNPFQVEWWEVQGDNESVHSYNNSVSNYLDGVSRPNDGNRFSYYSSVISYNDRYVSDVTPYVPSNTENTGSYVSTFAYIILAGDPVGSSSDLFATIGMTVLDNVYDTLQDQAIAIDIGLTGAEEDEGEAFVGAAADAFVSGEDAALGYGAVATPVPVAGAEELYPTANDLITDVEGLGVPSLGTALSTRFPFCIPYDINYLYKTLAASPERPVFTVDVIPTSLKTKIGITQQTAFTVDFGDPQYALMIKLVKWGTLVSFIIALAFVTKRLIWTTGG